MMLNRNMLRPWGTMLIAMLFVWSACNKSDNDVGLSIQPPGDKLNLATSDTTEIIAYSQLVDSVKTDETSISMLGSMLDPVFGRTTASFYTELRLVKTAFSFGENPVADSMILKLEYEKYYGDTNAVLTVKVYEMDERIHIDSAYFSNDFVSFNPTLLAQKTFTPDFRNDVIADGDTLDPHLRLNMTELTPSLVDKLLAAPADSMATNESFLNYFHGLYVTVESATSGGIIMYLDLISPLSRMTLHYHNDSGDSLEFDYSINSNCARFGRFVHDYNLGSTEFRNQVVYGDTALGRKVCYTQAMGGVKTHILLPNIRNYYDNGKIAVNEARLFLRTYEEEPPLPLATYVVLVRRQPNGGYSVLEDQLEGANYFGGYYDKNAGGYWFRITQTVQDLMRSDDPFSGFDLYLSGGAINAERVLIAGTDPQAPDDPEKRMKLVVTYTLLN
jgi:hypothetical protein